MKDIEYSDEEIIEISEHLQKADADLIVEIHNKAVRPATNIGDDLMKIKEFNNIKLSETKLPNGNEAPPDPEIATNILLYELKNSNKLNNDIILGDVTKDQMIHALESVLQFIDYHKFLNGE